MEKIPRKQRIGYATVHYVAKSRKMHIGNDGNILVLIGQPYYWWKWAFGQRQLSLTRPFPEQLDKYPDTVAKTWDNLKNQADEFTSADYIEDKEDLDNLISEIQSFIEEREEAISNMEEYFPESEQLESMKELLEEATETLEELESIEVDED